MHKHHRSGGSVLALALALGAGAPAFAQPVLRVYDARDLAAALPGSEGNGTYTIVPMLRRFYGDGGAELNLGVRGPQAAGAPADVLVSRLCAQIRLESEKLVDGVYLVKGEPADHEQFVALLEKTRALYQGAYEVEIVCYAAPAASAPAVGASADTGTPTLRTRQTVARRVPTPVNVTDSIAYVQDWTPVVGNQSVGYDPQISQVERGLSVVLLVGAGPDAKTDAKPDAKGDGAVQVSLRGQITDAQVIPFKALQAQPPGTTLEIGLPSTSARTISAETRIAQGKAVVLAVVPGFKAGESIVVGVSLREIK